MTREEAKKILKRIVNTSNELTHPVILNTEMGAIKVAIELLQEQKTERELIDRQQAIGKIKDWMKLMGYSYGERNVMECTIQMLEELPSAEPVTYCKDCFLADLCTWRREGAEYCSYAERKNGR